jgi:hypothetical protein
MKKENKHRAYWKWFRIGVMFVGGALIIFGFLANIIGFSTSGGFSNGRFYIVLLGFLLLLAGLLGSRFTKFYKSGALLLLNTVIIFILIELASSVAFKMQPFFLKPSQTEVSLPYYASQGWSKGYFQELTEAVNRLYYPWIVWRNAPYKGAYININQDGIRQTPGVECVPGAYKVFIFGGSTVWGYGSPDWGTIAAYIQAELKVLKNQPVCTINFGEFSYVSTQSLIELMTQLQKGNMPNLVIFYDGVNEVYSAYETGQACVHSNLSEITSRVNDSRDFDWRQYSKTLQLLQLLVNKSPANQDVITYRTMGVDTDQLAESIAKCYFGNYSLVGALAREYNFEYAFFWQPVISIGSKSMTKEEQGFRSDMDPALVDLYNVTYRIVDHSYLGQKTLFFLAGIFDNQAREIWIDFCHVTPEGNQLIAQEIMKKINFPPTGK